MSYVSHDGLAYFKHKLDQKFISNITSENGALKIILGNGTVLKSIQDTTVTQKKSTANELYPLLLCYDAMADQDQFSKGTWFGQHILANPYYGYLASRGMYVKHPTFNRRNGVSQKVEWAYDFTDAVSGLGNPMSQVYAYVDPMAQGGEHCIELRLYGNPNVSPVVPSVNDSTNTFSIGVGVTGGNVQFGYCPSTPLYLDNGFTFRTEATGHGNDIITRDWLNLNGSLTGLVHTTMNETIDGAKTFKKTVTINSGDNNNKAGLYVQGNSDVHGNEHVYGTETVDGKFTVNGTAEIKGGSGNTPSLTVIGNEYISGNSNIHGSLDVDSTATLNGNVHMLHNLDVDGNINIDGNETVGGNISTTDGNITTINGTISGKTGNIGSGGLTITGNETVGGTLTVTGKITGNGGVEISGGNGLKVNGNETVTGNLTVSGTTTTNNLSVTDDAVIGDSLTVTGDILKKNGNTTQNYFEYATTNNTIKNTIVNNIIKNNGGLAVDSNNEIYVKLKSNGGIVNDNGSLKIDFAVDSNDPNTQEIMEQTRATILSGLKIKIPLTSNKVFYVNKDHTNATTVWKNNKGVLDTTVGTSSKPFKTIQSAVDCITQSYDINTAIVNIIIVKGSTDYVEGISLPIYSRTTGNIQLKSADESSSSNFTVIRSTLGHNDTEDETITETSGTASTITVLGTGWNLKHLNIKRTSTLITDGNNHYDSTIMAVNGGQVSIKNCLITQTYSGNATSEADKNLNVNNTLMRIIAAYDQSQIYFLSESSVDTIITGSKGNSSSLEPLFVERTSQIITFSHAEDSYSHNVYINGSDADPVLTSIYNSQISCIVGQKYTYNIVGNITGPSCRCTEGSFIYLFNDIGTEAGRCETETFCWVKPSSLLE